MENLTRGFDDFGGATGVSTPASDSMELPRSNSLLKPPIESTVSLSLRASKLTITGKVVTVSSGAPLEESKFIEQSLPDKIGVALIKFLSAAL